MTPPLEDRKRRLRLYLLSSFVFLVVIWIFKLSHPQFSIIPSSSPSTPSTPAIPASKQKTNGKGNAAAKVPQPATGVQLASQVNSKVVLGAKAAVIIQPNFRQNIVPLILHFAAILGPSWPILIYTMPESAASFSASAALTRHLETQIQIRILPQTVLLNSVEAQSAFLTNSWLWESLDPAEHVLLFDSDSMLCANAARSVEDYFEYAFVGAPIKDGLGKGYNGGLSLRKRSIMLRVLDSWDYEQTKKEGDRFEDQWFYNRYVPNYTSILVQPPPIPSFFGPNSINLILTPNQQTQGSPVRRRGKLPLGRRSPIRLPPQRRGRAHLQRRDHRLSTPSRRAPSAQVPKGPTPQTRRLVSRV